MEVTLEAVNQGFFAIGTTCYDPFESWALCDEHMCKSGVRLPVFTLVHQNWADKDRRFFGGIVV